MPDWNAMFEPTSILEVILRGSIMYIFIFVLLRVIRREAGSLSIADVLVLVVIADAAQNGMAGDYQSITEGIVLVGTIVAWSAIIDWAAYNISAVGAVLHPGPVPLVINGEVIRKHLRENLITHDELMTYVRQAGVETLGEVKSAWLEANGEVSVVTAGSA